MPSLTRTMLLSAGRASIRAWLRSAHVDSPSLRRAAQSAYRSHAERVPWPTNRMLQVHLVFSVLPGAAVYTALQAQGASSAQASQRVEDALIAMAQPRRRVYARLVQPNHVKHRLGSSSPMTGASAL